MLEKYAQEISESLSAMMGRSIIITDVDGIIIGAPDKERIGAFHPPSVPCVKYKKMSFDDEDQARELGVWYPGSTVPLFFHGRVVGTAAIAGEPEIVLQFSTLVKNQIESMLRERVAAPSFHSLQRQINELVKDVSCFDPRRDDHSNIPERAKKLGIDLDIARCAISIFFSNFRGLGLEKNPVRLSYEANRDPLSDEIDYTMMHNRVIEIIREVFPDSQNVIASVSSDKFVILWAIEDTSAMERDLILERANELSLEIYGKLKDASIETVIGIGHPAKNIYEMPLAYSNAWEVVSIAEKMGFPSGVYSFNQMLLQHMLLSVKPHYSLRYMENKLAEFYKNNDSGELIQTFCAYCECFFSKQKASEKLHLHRNTLAYRLNKIEERFNISVENFDQVISLYLVLFMKKLGNSGGISSGPH